MKQRNLREVLIVMGAETSCMDFPGGALGERLLELYETLQMEIYPIIVGLGE